MNFERFKHWWKNSYWFHYKWHTIVGLVLILLTVLFIRDMATHKNPDFTFAVVTEAYVGDDTMEEIMGLFAERLTDINGDGEIYCLPQYLIMGDGGEIDMINSQKLATLMLDAESGLFIYSAYDGMFTQEPEAFVNLAEKGYDTVPGMPWVADITGLPLMKRAWLTGTEYYLVIRKLNDKDSENPVLVQNRKACFIFLDMLLQTP